MTGAPQPMAGYAGTPLTRKLDLKPGQAMLCLGLPDPLEEAVRRPDLAWFGAGREETPLPPGAPPYDAVLLFTKRRDVLEARLPELRRAIAPAGMIWVGWPKRAAKVATDMTEDVVRAVALPAGLVDVKVCAVDHVWSGLKLVIPTGMRQRQ